MPGFGAWGLGRRDVLAENAIRAAIDFSPGYSPWIVSGKRVGDGLYPSQNRCTRTDAERDVHRTMRAPSQITTDGVAARLVSPLVSLLVSGLCYNQD